MSSEYPRSHRVGDFIQQEIADLVRHELKDPRLSPMLTISAVDVSRDLSVARVYFTVIDEAERAPTEAALKHAAGFLRRQLARRMSTRTVPELRFYYDESSAHGARMSALIDAAVASNTTVADEQTDEDHGP